MERDFKHTKVRTVIRPARRTKGKWNIYIEAYPVYVDGDLEPTRVVDNPNITVTTPIFEETATRVYSKGSDHYLVKRDNDGVVLCTSPIDKASCAFAEQIRKIRQGEYDRENLMTKKERKELCTLKAGEEDFVEYFEKNISRLHPNGSDSVFSNWNRTLELFKRFVGNKPLPFKQLDLKLCNDFKYYLMACPKESHGKGTLAEGTVAQYVSVFKTVLKQAFIEDYMVVNLGYQLKGVSAPRAKRDTLDLEELSMLGRTKCCNPVVKRAALFTALTGLRHCDVKSIKWNQLKKVSDGWRLDFVQQKTGVPEYLPISEQAYSLCGTPDNGEFPIFKDLPAVTECNRAIVKWCKTAGIEHHITYHCFRHTFATLLLQKGIDLFTIKSMLGHTRVTTTEVYSHIADSSKRKAASAVVFNTKRMNDGE